MRPESAGAEHVSVIGNRRRDNSATSAARPEAETPRRDDPSTAEAMTVAEHPANDKRRSPGGGAWSNADGYRTSQRHHQQIRELSGAANAADRR